MTVTRRTGAAVAAFVLCLATAAAAQCESDFDLRWNVIAAGGATLSSGADFELSGTIGQAAASRLNGGAYALNGGFWNGLSAACVGDCGGDGAVTVDDVLTMLNIALGSTPISACCAGDANGDHQITIDEILTAVNNALSGCG